MPKQHSQRIFCEHRALAARGSAVLVWMSAWLWLGATAWCTGAEARRVSFRAEIAPILLEQCQTCHGPTQQKGGYRCDSFDFLSKNDDPSDPILVAGQPEKSRLYTLLVSKDRDDRMPQKADPLPAAQAELVRRWIAEGATFDAEDRKAGLVEIVPPRVHPGAPESYRRAFPVTALAFGPDGSELYVGGLREITVWDAVSGSLKRRIGNVAPRTFALAFDPTGGVLAAAGGAPGEYGEVRFFDPKSGEMRSQVQSSADAVMDVKFSPGGDLLATAGADRSVAIYELASGKRRHRLPAHSDAVTGVAFSPDGKWVASVGLDRGAKVFDATSGKVAGAYREHQTPLFAVAFLAKGNQLLTAGRKALHQWRVQEGKKEGEGPGEGDIFKVLVHQDQVFIGGSGKKVCELALSGLKQTRVFEGATDWIYALALDPGTGRLAAGCYDGSVVVWNLADGKLVQRFWASPGVGSSVASMR